ncbi:M48 family metalloprotease [Sphingomonas naphthae]|uniref:M48 family metalloprotease n=1 Tax=Sphingomonas naphthae TaxID=1813468 RepID=A0ABY7TJK9_9SPHN|nr:M48 family metalloprotease [Sphingomonas naphthae]WCT73411.1 M48 family metalloprotease [Sphingomonas naphthae]
MIRTIILSLLLATTGAASAQAQSISASDRKQGTAANPKLIEEFGGAYTGRQHELVEVVGRKVAVQSGLSRDGSDFTVTTLDSPVENAFAIPGGYIYITRQLLALMNSEDELASVLGHEVGHVAARHAAGRNSRTIIGAILAAGATLATGSDAAGRMVNTGAQLYTLKYGRDQEYQADALGIRYMTSAGYNPYASPEILGALDRSTRLSAQAAGQAAQNVPTWMSTHPNSAARVERAAGLAASTGKPEPGPEQDRPFLMMLDGLPYGAAKDGTVVRLVTVGRGDTPDSLAARMALPTLKLERFLTLNGLAAGEALAPGRLVKLIVAR